MCTRHCLTSAPGIRLGIKQAYIHNLMFVFSSWSKRCDSNLGVLVILPRAYRLHYTRQNGYETVPFSEYIICLFLFIEYCASGKVVIILGYDNFTLLYIHFLLTLRKK